MSNDLLKTYNVPTPRYTSYPPATFFHERFGETDFRSAILRSNQMEPSHLSFYIHIPFCPQLCHYCGCNSYPMERRTSVEAYMQALKKEIALLLPLLDPHRKIAQIHYGGGTPTSIPLHHLKEINKLFLNAFDCIEAPEIAIECHPAYLNETQWLELVEAGFNRCSLGIQDFDEEVLRRVHRKPSLLPVEQIVQLLKQQGVSVNMDFIYGLPGQTPESFEANLLRAAQMHPDRLVAFSYAHVPWVNPSMLKLEQAGLPLAEDKQRMAERGKAVMQAQGDVAIGMDHFVLPDDPLHHALQQGLLHRNFQGYCSRATTGQVYAFGVTAISQMATAYSQHTRSIPEYVARIEQSEFPVMRGYELNEQEQLAREVIQLIMCNNRLDAGVVSTLLGHSLEDCLNRLSVDRSALQQMQLDGLIEWTAAGIQVTEPGALYVRNVAALFDPLLRGAETRAFSKPV